MKEYSKRERVLFGLLLPVFGLTSVVVAVGLLIDAEFRRQVPAWLALLGGLGGSFVCSKILITGRSTAFLEQDL
jgi:hypothetical protein